MSNDPIVCAATVDDHDCAMRCIRIARIAVSWAEGSGAWTQSLCDSHAGLRAAELISLGFIPVVSEYWKKVGVDDIYRLEPMVMSPLREAAIADAVREAGETRAV